MIKDDDFDYLINQFDLGTSTAEKDPLLPAAQIRTQQFHDLWKDRIDIVRGIKGAGKTALYRVFYLLEDSFKDDDNIFCIFGVEPTGDPVFKNFRDYFSKFSEDDFQKFWTLYLLTLIRGKLNSDAKLQTIIEGREEAENIERLWKSLDVPFEGKSSGLMGIIESIMKQFPNIRKLEAAVSMDQSVEGVSYKPALSVEMGSTVPFERPKYIGEIRSVLCALLRKKNFRIWILLDRLDEVFPRRTKEEDNGLKGLLRTAYNLSEPELRIKVFLRDDIIQQLANSAQGFTALTHVTDRASPTMIWSRESILLLITKRLFSIKAIANYYSITPDQIDNNASYREEAFYSVFPKKIGKFSTLDWLISSLSDGNGIVTPRDIIDLFNLAKAEEYKLFQFNKGDREYLISVSSLKLAFEKLSFEKRDKFLFAEFPHLRDKILKLEGSYSIHNAQSLTKIYGTDWKLVVADLSSIGLLRHDPKKATFKVPKIWCKGLRITRGYAE